MLADADFDSGERTTDRVRLDLGGRPVVDGDEGRLCRRIALSQRHPEPILKRVEQRRRDRRSEDAERGDDRRSGEDAARHRLDQVGRGAPAPEHRPGERVEREPVIARIQKPERAAGGQHGPEVLEALSVGRRASDQRPGLAAEAHRAGSRAPRTPQPFRFHEHRLRQAGGARGEHYNSWSIERPEGRATDRARRRIRQHERNQTESLGLRRQRRHRRHERDRRTDRDGGLGAPRARVGRQEDGGRRQ